MTTPIGNIVYNTGLSDPFWFPGMSIMLTKSEVIASLNEAVKAHLGHVAGAQLSTAPHNRDDINTAVGRYIASVRLCRDFYTQALKLIEEEFKENE